MSLASISEINGIFACEMQIDDAVFQMFDDAPAQPKPEKPKKIRASKKDKKIASATRFSEIAQRWLFKEQKKLEIHAACHDLTEAQPEPRKKSIVTYISSPSCKREIKYLWQLSWQLIKCFLISFPAIFSEMTDRYLVLIFERLKAHLAEPASGAPFFIEQTALAQNCEKIALLDTNREHGFYFLVYCAANDCAISLEDCILEHVQSSFEKEDGALAARIFQDCFTAVVILMNRFPEKFCHIDALVEQTANLAHACRLYQTFKKEYLQESDGVVFLNIEQGMENFSRLWLLETSVWYAKQLVKP
jgi:hypothetical protein